MTTATQTDSWPEFPPPPPFEDDLDDEDDPCFDEAGDPQLDFHVSEEVALSMDVMFRSGRKFGLLKRLNIFGVERSDFHSSFST